MKIVIATDNSTFGEYLSYRLRGQGHQTAVANDGQQALDILKQAACDLLLIGIALDYLTGLEVLKQYHDFLDSLPSKEEFTNPHTSMKIIVITRIRNEKIQQNAFALGASHYLLLPLEPSLLMEKIG